MDKNTKQQISLIPFNRKRFIWGSDYPSPTTLEIYHQ